MLQQIAGTDPAPAAVRHIGRNIADRGYEARLATDDATRRDAYALRYRSYRAQGHLAANDSGLLFDKFDALPTTKTAVVYAGGRAVGSIRTCFLRRGPGTMSPCREVYPDEVDGLLHHAAPDRASPPGGLSPSACFEGVEVNRMVRAPEAADDQGLVFMLYRLAGFLALQADFGVIITCVRGHHLPFYRRLKFTEAGPPKLYPGLTCPMVLLAIGRANYDAMRQGFRLMDPEAGAPGLLDGLEQGPVGPPGARAQILKGRAMITQTGILLGPVTVLAVIACYGAGVWGLYGHFITKDRVESGMKLTSLLSLVGIVWFLAERWWRGALTGTIGIGRDSTALCLLTLFTALFWWAVATTRRRRLTLAFSLDQPAFIHTAGPYAWIRHPFYASYLLFWSAAAIASGSLAFWLIPLTMAVIYWRAIRIEEAKFAGSPISGDYMEYKTRTGMLLPALHLSRSGARHGG